MSPFQFLVAMLGGWLRHEQDNIVAFLHEENRVLKARSKGGGCDSTTASNVSPSLGTGCGPMVTHMAAAPAYAGGSHGPHAAECAEL